MLLNLARSCSGFFAAQWLKMWASFWCHEFLGPMEIRNNVNKLHWAHFSLIVFCKRCVCDIMNGSNKMKHLCYVFTYRVKHWIISAFNVTGLSGLSRWHRLHKQITTVTKLPLLTQYHTSSLFLLSCFWTVTILSIWGWNMLIDIISILYSGPIWSEYT